MESGDGECFLIPVVAYAVRARKPVRWIPGGEAVNRSTIVGRVADRMGLSRSMAEGAVDTVLEAIGEALAREEAVRIAGFGTFTTKSRAARTGRNPCTGESVPIPASKVPSFKAGKALRDVVNGVGDGLGGKRGRGANASQREGSANESLSGAGVPWRRGPDESPLTLEVSDWPGGMAPVWTLLDSASLQALRAEPSSENRALRLACDLADEELVESVFVRNALVVLEHAAAEAFVWLTDKGNFGRETVAWMREAMTWPDMEATEQLREGKALREQDVWELHLLHRLVDGAGVVDGRALMLLSTDLGREMLETGRRGALQARLFRQAFWRTDLSEFVRGEPRGLPGLWPQGDIGVVLWSLSTVADEWQRNDTLTALCTVPDDGIPTAPWNPAAAMFAWRVIRPLWWFGLIERSRTEHPMEAPRWRKSALFDRFLSFDVRLADGATPGH